MWNPFNNKWFYDEGVEWLGKGRWYMPIPGTSGNKKAKTTTIAIAVCVFVVALLGLSIWLGVPDYTYKKLPSFDILYDMMGRPVEDVAPIAGVMPGESMQLTDGTYKVPESEKYAGIPFETTLHFDEGLLSGFTYTAGSPADAKKAAKMISNVAEMFGIDSMQAADGTEISLSKKALRQRFEDDKRLFSVQSTANWTPKEHAYQNAVATYLRMLENDPDWEGRVGAYLVREARFYRQIHMSYQPDTQTVSVQIRFYVDIEPEG